MPCPRFVVACFGWRGGIYAALDGFAVLGGSVRLWRGVDLRRGVFSANSTPNSQASERAAAWVCFTGNDTGNHAGKAGRAWN